jgi:hypothetical protein
VPRFGCTTVYGIHKRSSWYLGRALAVRRIWRCLGPEKLGGIETFKVPDTLEVVPPPPIGPIEDSAALKPPISGYLDDELTFTEPVMPWLIACKDG